MGTLTDEAVQQIEQIHSRWIELECGGENHKIMTLCGDDIELWPPDAQPVVGRSAVSAQIARATAKILSIEIADRRIRGAGEMAYLTANYKTTSVAEDAQPRKTFGSHLWILERRAGTWVVTVVSWSPWVRDAGSRD